MRAHQRGMSMVVAIFLIVIVASLAAFAVSAGASQRESTNLQLAADRAMAAARAGSEWGAYRALVQGICPGTAAVPNPTTLNLAQAALRGYRVTVTCVASPGHVEGAAPAYSVYDITSFAQWGNFGAVNYASRTVVRRFNNGP